MFTFLTKFNKKGSHGLVYLHVIFMSLMFVYQMNYKVIFMIRYHIYFING